MQTPTLGDPRFASRESHRISEDIRIPERIGDGPYGCPMRAEPGIF
jgi:hypothetical protein